MTILKSCWKLSFTLVATTAMLAVPSANADTVALSFTGGAHATSSSDQLCGWQFSVNNAVQVTALGVYDDSADGLSIAHDVGIFRVSDQSLVASLTIPSGTGGSLIDGFRYYTLGSGLGLVAGEQYVIAMTMPAGNSDLQFVITNPPTTAPEITYVDSRFGGGSTLAFPTVTGLYVPGMFGPNFLFTDAAAVPEPSSIALAVIPAALWLAARARSRRRAG
jgi:hypothetical protein